MELDVHKLTLRDLDRIAREEGKMGQVAVGEAGGGKLLPWTEASTVPVRRGSREQKPNPALIARENRLAARMEASLHEGLPPIIRRDPKERYRALTRQLLAAGKESYDKLGYPVWPSSIQRELKAMGWEVGNHDLAGQVEALARRYIVDGANKQREKDQKKTTLDWSGHYSA